MARREGGGPSLLRAINLRAIFDVVHALGPVGAPQLVREARLSRPTVGEITAQLLELGLIRRVGRTTGSPGPGAQLYDVNPAAGWVLSLDIGHEWVRAGLTDLTGATVGRTATRTSPTSVATRIDELRRTGERLTTESAIQLADVDQVVVGTPGVLRPGDDHLSLAPNLPTWEGPDVVRGIEQVFEAPVQFENDVNLAAVGEHVQGVARGVDDFVLLSVGTGVGTGVILGGELWRGATGLAGEVGYLPVDMDDGRHHSPARWGAGPFEALASSSGVLDLAKARGISRVATAADVFTAARAGDAGAREIVDVEARRLAHAIAAVAAVLDPQLVVLGGGIGTGAGDLLLGPIREHLGQISPFSPRLAVSSLGSDAVIAGASALGVRLALDRIFDRAATLTIAEVPA
jgi:predicted NBD/HSP70 family sugar kinase